MGHAQKAEYKNFKCQHYQFLVWCSRCTLPARKNVLSHTQNRGWPDTMRLMKFLKKVSHLESLLQIVILHSVEIRLHNLCRYPRARSIPWVENLIYTSQSEMDSFSKMHILFKFKSDRTHSSNRSHFRIYLLKCG